jgi:alkanesulfonate monooxygenase SsuD/methylene tetrahydromethanopterin reductase-like flavin-dependent oxidoreductase (luciferase family)
VTNALEPGTLRIGVALQADLLLGAGNLHELGAAVMEQGLDHVSVGDHVAHLGGRGVDGLVAAAALAAAAPDLTVVVGAFQLALRHPLVAARQVATLTSLAPGRLVLAVGAGGDDRAEVENCGVRPETRGRRLDESLSVVRRLLSGERFSLDGEFVQLREVALADAGPVPPLVVAGAGPAAVRRAAALGDGWLGLLCSPERYAAVRGEVLDTAAALGRPAPSWWGLNAWCSTGANRAAAEARLRPHLRTWFGGAAERALGRCGCGTPDEVAAWLAAFADAGANRLSVSVPATSATEAIAAAGEVARSVRDAA